MSAASPSMRRRLDGQARDIGPGPSQQPAHVKAAPAVAANDNHACIAHRASALPPDARAIIVPLPFGVNQSGRAHARLWRLRFVPRWRPSSDPLTGWTGGGDPLAQVELRFADLDAAERYCRHVGVPFEISDSARTGGSITPCLTGEAPPRLCCSPTGPHALCCGDYPIGAHGKEQPSSAPASHSAFSFAG